MKERNTILSAIEPEVPAVVPEQKITVFTPMSSEDKPGVVKPDGEQFIVTSDGTLKVQPEYITRLQDVTDEHITYEETSDGKIPKDENGELQYELTGDKNRDEHGNTIVTVILSNGETKEFIVNKGDRGLPYIVRTTVTNYNEYHDGMIQIPLNELSRTPEIDDVIFTVMESGQRSWIALLDVINTEYGVDKLKALCSVEVVVETTGHDGPEGKPGDKGDEGVGIQDILFDKEVTDGYRYIVRLTNGKSATFVAPYGPEGQKGETGDPFRIAKTYDSVSAMEADFSSTDVKEGQFVVIDTGDVNDPDNAKLYVKGELSWKYITDLSGAIGIQGQQGKPGDTLTIQMGAEGIIEANRIIFTVKDAEHYLDKRKNLQKFLMSLYLPIVGTLDNSLPVYIEFGDTVYRLYNYLSGSDVVVNIGDLMSVATYSHEGGYFFNTEMIFLENSQFHGFAVIPSNVTANQLEQIIESNDEITSMAVNGKMEFHLSQNIKNLHNRTLLKPVAVNPKTQLVAIDGSNMQELIDYDETIKKTNSTIGVDESKLHGIRYDELQNLTEEQQARARSNIGAGSGSFSGSYRDLSDKPHFRIYDKDGTEVYNDTLESQGYDFSILAVKGDLEYARQNDDYQTVSNAEKVYWNRVADVVVTKVDKIDGTTTGTFTMEYAVANGIKLKNMIADANYDYVIVSDADGNMKKRAVDEVLSDIGGSNVQVNGVMAHDIDFTSTSNATLVEGERTNALGKKVKTVEVLPHSLIDSSGDYYLSVGGSRITMTGYGGGNPEVVISHDIDSNPKISMSDDGTTVVLTKDTLLFDGQGYHTRYGIGSMEIHNGEYESIELTPYALIRKDENNYPDAPKEILTESKLYLDDYEDSVKITPQSINVHSASGEFFSGEISYTDIHDSINITKNIDKRLLSSGNEFQVTRSQIAILIFFQKSNVRITLDGTQIFNDTTTNAMDKWIIGPYVSIGRGRLLNRRNEASSTNSVTYIGNSAGINIASTINCEITYTGTGAYSYPLALLIEM